MKTRLLFHLLIVLSLLLAALPMQAVQASPAASNAPADLLQFTAGGYILGFAADGMYAATGSHALHVDFAGANSVPPQADSPAGSDSKAAALSQVTYSNLWDGISLTYTAEAGSIYTTTYSLEPGANSADIRLRYNAPLSLNKDGTLGITFKTGSMTESAPLAWQEIDNQRVPVDASFRVHGQEVGFALGAYDPGYALTIDPSVIWNTFLGGSSKSEYGQSIAVDGSGNVYVAGSSTDAWGSPVRAYTGDSDAFAAKLNASGGLIWNTFLGASGYDEGTGIAVNASGIVYVVGSSEATWGSPVRAYAGSEDAFAAQLNASGGLLWNTFLGGSGYTSGDGIAVGGSGNAYVVGESSATWGSPVRAYTGSTDTFAAKLTASGGLTWNTFLGGSGSDGWYGTSIAVDGSGNVYVTGDSDAIWGSPVRNYTGNYDAFAAKLDSSGALTWNTFLGGSGTDYGYGIAVDGSGNIYVAGLSYTTWGSPLRAYAGSSDGFAARLSPSGGLIWNTFLGGSDSDGADSIAVDTSGNVYVTGSTYSTWGSPVRAYSWGDAFAVQLTSSGALAWNTFLGGSGNDGGIGIAVDSNGNVYVAGESNATWGNPALPYAGGYDAFAAGLDPKGDLNWNTFLGGSSSDSGSGIAVDVSGNVYVVGTSNASWGSPIRAYTGGVDTFVAKLNSSGGLIWNTFLGGSGRESSLDAGIAVDGSGNVYVSSDSDTTWGSPVRAYSGNIDVFAAKLTSSGALTWNTFLGGSLIDQGSTIAVDGSGNVYLTGYSSASWGSPVRAYTAYDAFVAKLTSSGGLTWNTFLGGSGSDRVTGIAVDGSGNVYVVGASNATWSCAPTACTVRAYTGSDAFVAKLNSSGGLTWNTFLGGSGYDQGGGIAVDGSGNVYVVGDSEGTWGSPVRAHSSYTDAFAAKLNTSGGLTWNTFLGGSLVDQGYGIATDGSGNVYVTGYSGATWGIPVHAYTGSADAFAARLDPSGVLVLNTFLGGNGSDVGSGIAVDSSRNVYVTGNSDATWGSPVRLYTGGYDAFVAKVDLTPPSVVSSLRASANPTNASTVNYTVNFSEVVTGVDAGDFTVNTSGITGTSVTGVSGSGTTYTVTVNTGVGNGTLRLDLIDNDTIVDAVSNPLGGTGAGNGSYTAGDSYTVDKTAPAVFASYRASPNPTNAASVAFTVPFTDMVTGVDASDFGLSTSGLSGASISTVSGSGTTYTVTVNTGTGSGTLRLDVSDNDTIRDLAGNPLGGPGAGNGNYTGGQSYTVDRTAPAVVSSLTASTNPSHAASVAFSVTFSEAVTGVDTSDFSLNTSGITGASVSTVSGSGTTYTITVNTGTGDGTLRLDVIDNDTILDLAGNPLGGAGGGNGNYTGGQTYTIDKTAPTVASSLRTNPSPNSSLSVDFTVTFSEAVTGVDITDFSLNTSGITGASVTSVSGSGTTYTISVDTGTGSGTIRLDVGDNDSILDLAGNPLGGAGAGNGNYSGGQSYTMDKDMPAVLSSVRYLSANPNNTGNVYFTVTFSSVVTGVDVFDFGLHTTSVVGASVSSVSGSGTTYHVNVNTGTGSGTLRLDVIDDDSIINAALNPLGGPGVGNGNYSGGESYIIDKIAPHVTASLPAGSTPTNATSVDFNVTFSEAVTGVIAGDFSLHTSGVTGAAITGLSGSGTAYTVTVNTGSGNGTIRLDVVDDDTILDTAGNPLSGGYTGGETYTITKEFTLTIVSANGTVAKNPNQTTYHEGDVVQLTAAPNAGWSFANWTGGLTSSVNPDSVTIHGNTSVTANYILNTYRIYLPLVIR